MCIWLLVSAHFKNVQAPKRQVARISRKKSMRAIKKTVTKYKEVDKEGKLLVQNSAM